MQQYAVAVQEAQPADRSANHNSNLLKTYWMDGTQGPLRRPGNPQMGAHSCSRNAERLRRKLRIIPSSEAQNVPASYSSSCTESKIKAEVKSSGHEDHLAARGMPLRPVDEKYSSALTPSCCEDNRSTSTNRSFRSRS
ncbi:hypothetical protein B0H17DRAFT_113275 [Mycena rosella]|uniref:Uncharacterized protein n=1 Tax=Mycena rosella TaxID=1033263 RepID=A0AAD7D3P2_MYCRO|nr:hypothetical protein B0H17DRAFT_113275 [Mycena rosella]